MLNDPFIKSGIGDKSEGEAVCSIVAIIVMSRGGIPYFQDRFDDFVINSTLVAGITSALSSYMDEFVHENTFGFESIKKSDLIISSLKSELSTITIVSRYEIPSIMIHQINRAQLLLDKKYQLKLEGLDQAQSFMDPKLIYRIFDAAGFKLGLKKDLTLHEDSILEVRNDRSIGPNFRFQITTLRNLIKKNSGNGNIFNLDQIRSHFIEIGVKENEVHNLLVLAYENMVIRSKL
ncbi:MAG: hypothetical protein HeimC2_09410 [Candidatus Heimdallarchaeota archaeon LC_2]|nr:MAG: hypothetical protein HeimC2_09410 [Candidatus Heimdallarchaeota archaeon LC_2]